MKRLILAAVALSLLGSCEKSRVDVMAASKDELISRCIDERQQGPEWDRAKLDLAGTKVKKRSDGFDIACAFTLHDGRRMITNVIVACPADTAVPCSSSRLAQ